MIRTRLELALHNPALDAIQDCLYRNACVADGVIPEDLLTTPKPHRVRVEWIEWDYDNMVATVSVIEEIEEATP